MENTKTFSILAKQDSRLNSLDVLRGVTIAGMILVTDPGTYAAVYSQLMHSPWNGATATDMIFPCFLFMVGFSVSLSLNPRMLKGIPKSKIAQSILYRSIVLFLIGLAINGFPYYNFSGIRLPGILQRIAVCYFCCSFFYLYQNKETNSTSSLKYTLIKIGALSLSLLIIYSILLFFIPVPGIGKGNLDSFGNLPAYIDRKIIGLNHMWIWGLTPGKGVTYDPEGILSTIPAIASTLIGLLVGEWWLKTGSSVRVRIITLCISGSLLIVTGLLLSIFLPVNKRIWTPSFALLSSGVSMILFPVLYFIVDVKKLKGWTFPFLVLGTNAILAFIISSITLHCLM